MTDANSANTEFESLLLQLEDAVERAELIYRFSRDKADRLVGSEPGPETATNESAPKATAFISRLRTVHIDLSKALDKIQGNLERITI